MMHLLCRLEVHRILAEGDTTSLGRLERQGKTSRLGYLTQEMACNGAEWIKDPYS